MAHYNAAFFVFMLLGMVLVSSCGVMISVRTGVSSIYLGGFFLGTVMVSLSSFVRFGAIMGATIRELQSRIQKLEAGSAQTA